MTAISTRPEKIQGAALWRTAQLVGVVSTVVLVVGLVVEADIALDVLWNVLIPLIPASLLISPAIWRNVCPLATINRFVRGRTLTTGMLPAAAAGLYYWFAAVTITSAPLGSFAPHRLPGR